MPSDEQQFLKMILDDPSDENRRLVYADWLEEQGDWRGPVVRSFADLGVVLAKLKSEHSAPLNFVNRIAAEKQRGALLVCLDACRELIDNRHFPAIVECTLEHLARLLAFMSEEPGADIVLCSRYCQDKPRELASLLAAGQPFRRLAALFDRFRHEERCRDLLSCLAHEMLLRDMEIREDQRPVNDELAWLPIRLMEIEDQLPRYLPQYDVRFSAVATPSGAASPSPLASKSPGAADVAWHEQTIDASAIALVVQGSLEQSNGKVEIRLFQASRLIQDEDLSVTLLRSLDLESLRTEGTSAIHAMRVTPNRVLSILFGTAANGGAYDRGLMAAHGRLAAWRSLGALVGVGPDATVPEIQEAARRSQWIEFSAQSEWFYNVAWDLGIAAVRPDRRSLAVFAATDTD